MAEVYDFFGKMFQGKQDRFYFTGPKARHYA